jgi:putative transposase
MRYTTFRLSLDPTPAQEQMLARWAGASRFAYNQGLRLVTDALAARRVDPSVTVPWSGLDLINAFNAWKKSEAAGRIFVVALDGTVAKQITGLTWRHEVYAQVFEEAAVDCGRALAAYREAKTGNRKGRRVGFPRYKRKGRRHDSFRVRNKKAGSGSFSIRVGEGAPRSVILPGIGALRVHDDTRRLRRLLRPVEQLDPLTDESVVSPRARILFATVRRHSSRWYVCLNMQAPDLHPRRRHQPRSEMDRGGFVGVDRGLAAFAVVATADGTEIGRLDAPKPLVRRLERLRRRSRALSRAKRGSRNRIKAARRLAREHARIANVRGSFLHEVSTQLAKTHSRLAIEDLAVADLIRDRHRARAIGDAAWAEFGRRLRYKTAWLGGELMVCDRWFPSTRTCSGCTRVPDRMGLAERTFRCGCGLIMDRDRNAAASLAAWAEHAQARTAKRAAGSPTPLEGKALAATEVSANHPLRRRNRRSALAGAEDIREG